MDYAYCEKNMGENGGVRKKRLKTAQPVMINCTEARPAASQQNTFVTHAFMFVQITSIVFSRPLAPSSGPALNKWGVTVSCFLAPEFTLDVLTKCVFKDNDRQTATSHSYTFIGKKEPNELDLKICSHLLQSTYFF